jgi:methylenetetrahydrofolate reductase (NADPH)
VKALKSSSRLEKLLEKGEFVVTAELGPPKSIDTDVIESKIAALKDAVDAVNITDNQTAIVRISSIGAAFYVMQHGLEPVVQITCRDRNRLAIQSDLLGAYLNGARNVLCLTGDHQSFGNHPQAKQVFDIDSIQLIRMIKKMRDDKVFQCGEEIRNSKKAEVLEPKFYIGAAANPFADPLDLRALRLEKKVHAGADFIQTQCIYDMERFEQWMQEIVKLDLHAKTRIIAGITPIRSLRMLNHMREHVAGVSIPDALYERIAGAEDPKEEGIRFAVEQIGQFKSMKGVAGVHIMAIEWESAVPDIVKAAGMLPRPKAA